MCVTLEGGTRKGSGRVYKVRVTSAHEVLVAASAVCLARLSSQAVTLPSRRACAHPSSSHFQLPRVPGGGGSRASALTSPPTLRTVRARRECVCGVCRTQLPAGHHLFGLDCWVTTASQRDTVKHPMVTDFTSSQSHLPSLPSETRCGYEVRSCSISNWEWLRSASCVG